MKFVTFIQAGRNRVGVVDGDFVFDLNQAVPEIPSDLRQALKEGVDLQEAAAVAMSRASERLLLSTLSFGPLIPHPGKVICLGLNYFDHAKEGGRQRPDYPWFFTRTPTSLLAHNESIFIPAVSSQLDYEAELAVVVGRYGKSVPADMALDLVFGYTCFNDVSIRDYQKRTPQWTIGKNFDRTGAFGPVLVTADEVPPGASGLRIEGRLNGETMQLANTSDMIWDVATTISLLTDCMTLEPGDVVVMGTPAGVGQSRNPPVWMKNGDRFEVSIEKIGTLVNDVRNEPRIS